MRHKSFGFSWKVILLSLLTLSFLIYSMVLYTHPPKSPPENGNALLVNRGKMIWQAKNCGACHQLYGLGGHLGPDLTNVMSLLPEGYVDGVLMNGTNIMPNFHLSESERTAIKAFLKNVDQTGKADPRKFKTNYDGFIH